MTNANDELIDDVKKSALRWTLTIWKRPTVLELPPDVTYFLAVREICPTTNKEHWQSYAEFRQPVRFGAVKKFLNDKTVSCRISKGSGPSNSKYCKKTVTDSTPPGDVIELGTMKPGQGSRTDLASAKRKRDDEEWTMEDLMMNEPRLAMQYRNGWRDVEKYAQRRKAATIDEAEIVERVCDDEKEMMLTAREYTNSFIVPESGMFDEYQGQDTLVFLTVPQLSDARLRFPIQQALPGKYNTTYPAWKKVILIRIKSMTDIVLETSKS